MPYNILFFLEARNDQIAFFFPCNLSMFVLYFKRLHIRTFTAPSPKNRSIPYVSKTIYLMHIIKCRLAIFEKLNGRINHDASKSSSLKFDIYKKNIKTWTLDLIFIRTRQLYKCYVQGQFNDLLRQKKFDDNRISFMYVNVCSLQ